MTPDRLAKLFQPYGNVIGAKLVEDRTTGKKKGFGFITFKSMDSVEPAIASMHNAECEGRQLTVKQATARGEKPESQAIDTKGSFKARFKEKKQEGKMMGWGGGDDDWA
eukprot:gnl/MRDRNA2_/MRDRNA2_20477_c0_seq1.p1 gnl/MRDRNA2_/MRDRNA2_20477_c0~~gnl/MRDRNA2_/MRDRNA2_20477_c0_seq1.p1  ORF type:complete len:123 (-),score=33.12 gnl/MRDRNA2_/MRDRNA2_20477_c0_seq1:55-381(-)